MRDLLEKIALQDCKDSFKIFYDHYFSQLFDIAKFYLKSTLLAEEVVSDVFLKVWFNRTKLHEIVDIKSYLFIAIKRQSLNYLKKEKRDLLYIDELDFDVKIESKPSDWEVMNNELILIYQRAIKSLPEKCRIVYIMAKENQLKYKEISSLLNLSVKTVESHMNTAIKKLKIFLEQYTEFSNFDKIASK